MGNIFRRLIAAYKLSKGRCAECSAILPDSGAPYPQNTCSEDCAFERWASVTA